MSKASILIVEDEAIIAMEVERTLQNLGYEITAVVNSGDDAIQKAEEDKPDLILMDIRIQGDKDGIETAEIIREKFGIPVIFSTAYLDKERIDRAKITMPFGYVLKPIQARDLRVTVEMALYIAKVDAERRIIQNELELSERLLNDSMAAAKAGSWQYDVKTSKIRWTKGTYEIFELPFSYQPKLQEAMAFAHDQERMKKSFDRAVNEGESYEYDAKIMTAKGNTLWIQSNVEPQIKDGKVVGVIGAIVDITRRKQIENDLQHIFDLSPDMIGMGNLNGYFTKVNRSFEQTLGYSSEELTSKPILSFMHEDDRERSHEATVQSKENLGNVFIENRFISKNGAIKWIEWNMLTLPQEDRFYSVGRDITNRKEGKIAENANNPDLITDNT